MGTVLIFIVFLWSSISSAQECSCPVIKCEPCQRRLVIDSQKIQCTAEKSVLCENVVCENVDNYFQCIAGAPGRYLPTENLQERFTEPRLPPMATPLAEAPQIVKPVVPELDFQHFNQIETKVFLEEKPGVGIRRNIASQEVIANKKSKDLIKKDLLNAEPSTVPSSLVVTEVPFVMSGLKSARINGKKITKTKKYIHKDTIAVVSTKQKEFFKIIFGETQAQLEMNSGSEIRFEKEGAHLVLYPQIGDFVIKEIFAKEMIVFDAGEWRVGKSTGQLRWTTKQTDVVIKNEKEHAFLRRDQLIAKSESIDPGMELVISSDFGIVYAEQDTPQTRQKWNLKTAFSGKKNQRLLASSALAMNGCTEPKGEVQQCAWKCFGAKNKSKQCTNSEVTQCVRFTCSIGGEWKLPTRVPSNECQAHSVVVDSCQ